MRRMTMLIFLTVCLGPMFALNASKKLEITVGIWDVQSAFAAANDPVLQYVQDKFNVTFKPAAMGWDDWTAKLNLWAASGDMPDIAVTADRTTQLKMMKQGVFRALPDLGRYPNLEKIFELGDVKPLAMGGKFYEIPRLNSTPSMQGYGSDRTIIVRQDWMKKLGITKNPETFEQFYALAKAMTNKTKQVYGAVLASPSALENLLDPQEPALLGGHWVKGATGRWVPATMSKNFVTGLQQASKLYNDGLLDPDSFIMKDKVGLDKFAQGKAGILFFNGGPSHLKELYSRWMTYPDNPDFASAVTQIPAWKNTDGKVYRTENVRYWSNSVFSSKVGDEKMDRILAIYDFLASDEGLDLVIYGLEGVDYQKAAGTKVILREKDPATGQPIAVGKKYPSVQSLFQYLAVWSADVTMWRRDAANAAAYGAAPLNIAMDSMEWRKANTTVWTPNWDIVFLDLPNRDKYSSLNPSNPPYQDAVNLIVKKEDIATMWPKVIAKYRSQGLDKIIDDVNNAIKR